MLSQLSESGVLHSAISDLNLVCLEVAGSNCLEDGESYLDGLSVVPLAIILFELLFKMAHCFLLLRACRNSSKPDRLARWIDSENLRTKFFIASYKSHVNAEGSDSGVLRILLEVLSQSLSDDVDGSFIKELELVLSCLLSQPRHDKSGIVHVSYDDCAACIADTENVGDRVCNNQFIWNLLLAAHNDGILAPDCDGSHTCLLNGFEGILHLVNAAVWREDLHGFFHTHLK